MEKILEIKNLNVSFKQRRKQPLHIVRNVDFSVRKGDIVGIVGESGSGKSVFTKALMNVNNGDITTFDSYKIAGREFIKISGKINKKSKIKKLNGRVISYIPQNPMTSMNPSRTIKKHMLDVLENRSNIDKNFTKSKKEHMQKIKDILTTFKIIQIERILASYPHELSGGLKQRIIIAMAILAGAQIIVADEPTTALDATVQSSVLSLIQDIRKEFKISFIFISHNIAIIAKLCDYIYVMYAGKVLEKATKKELFTNPKHPYTWALIASIPDETKSKTKEKLYAIQGTPPDMANLPAGDSFAPRNEYAMAIDFKQSPPLFKVSQTHFAATWTLHPSAKRVSPPDEVQRKISSFKETFTK